MGANGEVYILPVILGDLKSHQAKLELDILLDRSSPNGYYLAQSLIKHVNRLIVDNIKNCMKNYTSLKANMITEAIQWEMNQHKMAIDVLSNFTKSDSYTYFDYCNDMPYQYCSMDLR